MELEDIITEREKGSLNRFVNDKVMLEAVKKILFSGIYFEGTIRKEGIAIKNFTLDFVRNDRTNDEIGADLRAAFMAIKLLERGFEKIVYFSKQKNSDNEKIKNPAR